MKSLRNYINDGNIKLRKLRRKMKQTQVCTLSAVIRMTMMRRLSRNSSESCFLTMKRPMKSQHLGCLTGRSKFAILPYSSVVYMTICTRKVNLSTKMGSISAKSFEASFETAEKSWRDAHLQAVYQ